MLSYLLSSKLRVKGATLRKLVEKATPAHRKERDRDLIVDLVLTHQMFTTSSTLLDHLIQRFHGPSMNSFSDPEQFYNTLKGIQNRFYFH